MRASERHASLPLGHGAGEPSKSRRSPPLMDTRNFRGAISALPVFWEGIDLLEGIGSIEGRELGVGYRNSHSNQGNRLPELHEIQQRKLLIQVPNHAEEEKLWSGDRELDVVATGSHQILDLEPPCWSGEGRGCCDRRLDVPSESRSVWLT
ncbi:hypothetical protein EVAR_80354_1 [Eumeta japonica]|uniref:Uncharacterized protein n=1 Tax=Eumeta variegata TaxID=151549 RepID=A0A4C1WYZ8_EUMVA|nr:hypothetical protein EVAR_80354_1 [Eumeta japonica]